jgi:hypothetical protein
MFKLVIRVQVRVLMRVMDTIDGIGVRMLHWLHLTIYFGFSGLVDIYLKGIHRMNNFKHIEFIIKLKYKCCINDVVFILIVNARRVMSSHEENK